MYENNFVSVIVAAAGMSNRMRSRINKQFIFIDNKPVLAHTLEKFEMCKYVDEIIVVAKEDEIDYCKKEIVKKYDFKKVSKVVKGGKERQDSVYNGLLALDEKCKIVLIHDGARPFVKVKNIEDGISGVTKYGACVVGAPVKDTIKVVDDNNDIKNTPHRSQIWAAQTPQCFWRHIIMQAYKAALDDNFTGTDDSMLVERLGVPVKMIMGSYENIKITTPDDLIVAESMLKDKEIIFKKRNFVFQGR
ncbi:2-C-methyl-D-erythritol 4-phosphate cytidylyltransferase [Sporanaerobacter acetigenes]|uniref:2-C-methyl-D-erythritol 4-phosphate cytidylyltransferase n=1 Tax=Sporanaerobacter acetigenes DSM 13106 TaxID=1123281 RepID=A0A1M5YQK0_9FIRM|nr:2-C-methyl-D-erythritol 4-phosphate cytidylyltransferase [Sporanaerobacter acetigenes]SHI14365.1 2-C-methyl-D-erythritol 4-phosphate cytidylyltransferase [Sporanaerobacter acetigenes DSM 13106]